MTKKSIILSSALLICLALFSVGGFFAYKLFFCEEIKGKIMVVQRNAEVRRLPMIRITAVSSREAEQWRQRVSENCRRLVEEAANYRVEMAAERKLVEGENDATIMRISSLFAAASESRDSAREFWIVDPNQPTKKRRFFVVMAMPGFPSAKAIEEDALASRWDKCYEYLRNSVVPELNERLAMARQKKVAALAAHDAEVQGKLSELGRRYSDELSHDSLTEIPGSVSTTATVLSDENGDFSMTLPVGEYYLIARGSRRVLDVDERYYWAMRVKVPSDEAKRCLMGNTNMLSGPDPNLWSDLEAQLTFQKASK